MASRSSSSKAAQIAMLKVNLEKAQKAQVPYDNILEEIRNLESFMTDDEAWQEEMHSLFEDEEQEATTGIIITKKRMARSPTKDVRAFKKMRDGIESDDDGPSLVDAMALLTVMRREIQENRKDIKKDMRKICNVLHGGVKVEAQVKNAEESMRTMNVKVEALESFETRIESEMKALKTEVAELRSGAVEKVPPELKEDARSRCAVWGGLKGSFEEAVQWVKNELEKLDIPPLVPEFFVKTGDGNFRNILFTKFDSKQQRDEVVQKMRQRFKDEIEDAWVKPDMPVKVRAVNGFLLGLKHLLTSWGYNKAAVKVDLDFLTLTVADEEVVRIVESEMKWHASWEAWDIFMKDDVVVELKQKFDLLMSRSGGKGKGKAN